jgi:hypothetical protein
MTSIADRDYAETGGAITRLTEMVRPTAVTLAGKAADGTHISVSCTLSSAEGSIGISFRDSLLALARHELRRMAEEIAHKRSPAMAPADAEGEHGMTTSLTIAVNGNYRATVIQSVPGEPDVRHVVEGGGQKRIDFRHGKINMFVVSEENMAQAQGEQPTEAPPTEPA